MPLNLASPGIVVREVDLTVGRVDPTSDKIGGIVSPFAQGPVELPTIIENENNLYNVFGKPYSTDKHYEHWLTASSYLAYGGSLRVVRADDDGLKNAYVGSGSSIKIKSLEHYEQLSYDENVIASKVVVSKNPGSWANGLRIGIIDAKADQILGPISTASVTSFSATISDRSGTITGSASTIGITTTAITLGQEVNCDVNGVVSAGTTVIGISTNVITISSSSLSAASVTTTFDFGSTTTTTAAIAVGYGITQAISSTLPGAGSTSTLNGYLKGIITEVQSNQISVKVLSHVSAAGTETLVDYQPAGVWAFSSTGTIVNRLLMEQLHILQHQIGLINKIL